MDSLTGWLWKDWIAMNPCPEHSHHRNEGFIPILQRCWHSGSCQFSASLGSRRDPNSIKFLFLAVCASDLGSSPFPGMLRKRERLGGSSPGFVVPCRAKNLGEFLESKVQFHEQEKPGCMRFLQQAQPTVSILLPETTFSFDFSWKTALEL